MSEEIKVSFVEAELTKISLGEGDVLSVKFTTSNEYSDSSLEVLRKSLDRVFPNNKIMVFGLRDGDRLHFEVIKQPLDCGTQACEDCSCGKAELLKGDLK